MFHLIIFQRFAIFISVLSLQICSLFRMKPFAALFSIHVFSVYIRFSEAINWIVIISKLAPSPTAASAYSHHQSPLITGNTPLYIHKYHAISLQSISPFSWLPFTTTCNIKNASHLLPPPKEQSTPSQIKNQADTRWLTRNLPSSPSNSPHGHYPNCPVSNFW